MARISVPSITAPPRTAKPIPAPRKKPPNNVWKTSDIIAACVQEPLIQYLAISNVESYEDCREIHDALESCQLHNKVCIVPKIESIKGVNNIDDTLDALYTNPQRTIMIDHDDLFTDLVKNNIEPSHLYTIYILPLIRKCKKYDVRVLRTAGVVFCDN